MEELQSIIFVGGKGGVGKSTSAAALAYKSSLDSKKVLLVSTDPAHNLGDIFNTTIGGEISRVTGMLSAIEIDPEKETNLYINGVKENLKGLVKSKMVEEVHRQIDTAKSSPGAEEAALFDKLVSIILEESENYDTIIVDTAPTGHTIRLLSLPELMGVWMKGMLDRRKKTNENYSELLNDGDPIDDPIYNVLKERQDRFSRVRGILLDPEQTSFVFVLNPEKLPILETEKALNLLDTFHLHVKTLIVNKILPETDDSEFFSKRKKQEAYYLRKIDNIFTKQTIVSVPFFSDDITSEKELKQFSTYFKEG